MAVHKPGLGRTISVVVVIACLAALAGAVACLTSGAADNAANHTGQLGRVEITEYEGVDLSSIDDFRENSIKGPQYVDMERYRLEITGLVEKPAGYTFEQVTGDHETYAKVVTRHCVEGWSVDILWEGVLVEDLIREATPTPEATVVIFHAYDGYTTSLPLDYIMGNEIVLAHKMNDVLLPPERGAPFQLVAESKWGYKWIKWITKIELSDDSDYRGYWEARGYSNDADENEAFFER